jgi:hypothetical protein
MQQALNTVWKIVGLMAAVLVIIWLGKAIFWSSPTTTVAPPAPAPVAVVPTTTAPPAPQVQDNRSTEIVKATGAITIIGQPFQRGGAKWSPLFWHDPNLKGGATVMLPVGSSLEEFGRNVGFNGVTPPPTGGFAILDTVRERSTGREYHVIAWKY